MLMLVAAAMALCGLGAHVKADVMDGVNDFATPYAYDEYFATEVGWYYTPSSSYVLTGVETQFYDTVGGECTLEIFKNGPPPVGGSVLLGSAAFTTTTTYSPTWSGGTFLAPVALTSGTTYFVGFRNVSGFGVNYTDTTDPRRRQLAYRFGPCSGGTMA